MYRSIIIIYYSKIKHIDQIHVIYLSQHHRATSYFFNVKKLFCSINIRQIIIIIYLEYKY